MKTLLIVDTSSEAQVVGVFRRGELLEQFEMAGRGHSQKILPTIRDSLATAGVSLTDIEAIVYGRGPGSFTGVRIGVGVVQGLAFGLDIPVVGISTLAGLAQDEFHRSGARNIVVALSARAEEVYFGSYVIDDELAQLQGDEGVFDASAAPRQAFRECNGVGSGWGFRESLERSLDVTATDVVLEVWPRARGLLELGLDAIARGKTETAAEAQPEYLREQVARPGGRQ